MTGTGAGAGHSPLGDFHYVAMLVPPSASSRGVGSLVIASGQNGVLASSYSSTKSIDLLFSACGSSMGRFEQELWIVSLADRLDQKRICCTATVVPSQSQFVDFPDLKYDTVTGKLQQLELGLIQIQSAAAVWPPMHASSTGVYPPNRKARSNYYCVKSSMGASTSFFSLPLTTAAPSSSSVPSVSFSSENSPDVTTSDTGAGMGVGGGAGQKALYNHKLRVVNVSSKRLLVTAVSNLKSQCFLFADEQCTVPVLDTPLPSRPLPTSTVSTVEADNSATLIVYVVIRPSALLSLPSSSSSALDKAKDGAQFTLMASDSDLLSPTSSSSSSSASAVGRGQTPLKSSSMPSRALSGRELVGGIRLLFFEAHPLLPVPPPLTPPLQSITSETSLIPFASTITSTTDRDKDRDHSSVPPILPISAPRKLFESTVVFRAYVGQSVLKAKVITPRLPLHPTPTPTSHTYSPTHSHSLTHTPSHSLTHSHPHIDPYLSQPVSRGMDSALVAVGHITLTNASPTFPLHYRHPQCSPHTQKRVLCLPCIGQASDEEVRQYVLSSLSRESSSDGGACRGWDAAVSTLVLLCPLHQSRDGKDNVIPPDRTITLMYAIVAPMLPPVVSGTVTGIGTGIGVGTGAGTGSGAGIGGPFEGICVHDLDILNTHTREVTSLVVSALFHTGRLAVTASPSTTSTVPPSVPASASLSAPPSVPSSAPHFVPPSTSLTTSVPSSSTSSSSSSQDSHSAPPPSSPTPSTPIITILGDISGTSTVLPLKCSRALRVTRLSKQQKFPSDEPVSHTQSSSGINSSNTYFAISDPMIESAVRPNPVTPSQLQSQDIPVLSRLTLHAAHTSRSSSSSVGGDGGSSSSSDSDGLQSNQVEAHEQEQGQVQGVVSYLRVLPVSNLSIRISSEEKEKEKEKYKDKEKEKDREKEGSVIVRQTGRDKDRDKEKDRDRDSRKNQEHRIGQSVGGGLRVCGEPLLIPLGHSLAVQIHCHGDEAEGDRGALVKGSGLASVLAHCFNVSPLSPKPIKSLSVKGIVAFMLLPAPVCADPEPLIPEGFKVSTADTFTALSLKDPMTAVTASIKKNYTVPVVLSNNTIECGQVKQDGQRGEDRDRDRDRGKEKERCVTPSSSSALLSMFDRSPPPPSRVQAPAVDSVYGTDGSERFITFAEEGKGRIGGVDVYSGVRAGAEIDREGEGEGQGQGETVAIRGKTDSKPVPYPPPMLHTRALSSQAAGLAVATVGGPVNSFTVHPMGRSQSQSHLRPLMPPPASPRPPTLGAALAPTPCTSPMSTAIQAVQAKPACTGGFHGLPLLTCCTLTLDLIMDSTSLDHNTPHTFSHTGSTSHSNSHSLSHSHTSNIGNGNGLGIGMGGGSESASKSKSGATSAHKKITSFADLSLAFMQS